jgi:cytochrome P450 family 6
VGIFSSDKPSLVIRDLELVKNILVKDFHTFTDRTLSADKKLDPLFASGLGLTRSQLWRQLKTNLTPVFTSGKMKTMFYLLDTCGKVLADYLDKTAAGGKFFQDNYSYTFHFEIELSLRI